LSSINTLGKNGVASGSALETKREDVDVETVLIEWWQKLLGLEQVSLDDDFFDLGGNSLMGVELFSEIKKTYGLDFGLSTLFETRSVRQLAQHIRQESKANHPEPRPWSPLVPIQPQGSRPPLFWLPGGYGTNVMQFREVSLLLGPDQPVYGFEAKMPEPDQELESIPERAAHFIREMRSLQPHGPYSLIGFCGGGYVAFEMAQQLLADGQKVAFLGIVECAHPRYPNRWPGKLRFYAERGIWRVRNFLKRGLIGIAQWAAERSKSLVQSIYLRAKRAEAKLLGKPVPALPSAPLDIYDKAWRNVLRYYPVTYRGRCVVLIGKDSWDFCGLSSSVDPRLAWCKLSEGGSETRAITGSHLDLLEAPIAYRFAEELKYCLERSNAFSS
jgi:thioesterase domain-containing protein/acyl carrier protein